MQAYEQSFNAEGLIEISTNSKIPQKYTLFFSPSVSEQYTFNLLQGEMSPKDCEATIQNMGVLAAGETVTVIMTPKDQFKNTLIMSEELLSSFGLIYKFNGRQGTNAFKLNKNQIEVQ